jgi:hypothetical protein
MVTRGMMNFARDDLELALVVAHEIAHNSMKHIDAKKQNMGCRCLGGYRCPHPHAWANQSQLCPSGCTGVFPGIRGRS